MKTLNLRGDGGVVVSEPGVRGAGLGGQLVKVLDESRYRYPPGLKQQASAPASFGLHPSDPRPSPRRQLESTYATK